MNEQLKDAILKTIACSTVKRNTLDSTTTYRISAPTFFIEIIRYNMWQSNEYKYTIRLNNTTLLQSFCQKNLGTYSLEQRAALEIWDALENKYIKQQPLDAPTKQALTLMQYYIATQEYSPAPKQSKTR